MKKYPTDFASLKKMLTTREALLTLVEQANSKYKEVSKVPSKNSGGPTQFGKVGLGKAAARISKANEMLDETARKR
jgi:hypothetical protein